MKNKPTRQELYEVQNYFGLPNPALVEKDWYVVQTLAAISQLDTAPFQLVFGGGTSLSRAYRLIHRMSEDIDLKVIASGTPKRAALRTLREKLTQTLLSAGFRFDPNDKAHRKSQNESRYTLFHLPYDPLENLGEVLRPEIKVEVALWPLRCSSIERPITSFIAEAFRQPPEVPNLACVSVIQTAAEKFVALTRRVAEEIAIPPEKSDHALVRHIYDLHAIRACYDPAETIALAYEIMLEDADIHRKKFPAYKNNPITETLKAIAALQIDPKYAQNYAAFHRDMVYGEEAIDYATGLSTINALCQLLPTEMR